MAGRGGEGDPIVAAPGERLIGAAPRRALLHHY
jgi:hypothetical protein